MNYDPTPGDFDHRGGDCDVHGSNVPTFRAKGELGPFLCVECSLDVLAPTTLAWDGTKTQALYALHAVEEGLCEESAMETLYDVIDFAVDAYAKQAKK